MHPEKNLPPSSSTGAWSAPGRLPFRSLMLLCIWILLSGSVSASPSAPEDAKRLVILAFSGANPALIQEMMENGDLPALSGLSARGGFLPLKTTTPASPEAAWTSFATGLPPERHGIYGALRRIPGSYETGPGWMAVRDREQPLSYLSLCLTALILSLLISGACLFILAIIFNVRPAYSLKISAGTGAIFAIFLIIYLFYSVPRQILEIEPLLKAPPFWEALNTAQIPAFAVYAPASFPCGHQNEGFIVTGPGTPDFTLRGAFWTLYTDRPEAFPFSPSLGNIVPISFENAFADTFLPAAPISAGGKPDQASVSLNLRYFNRNKVIQIDIGGTRDSLRRGEWSDYFVVKYRFRPMVELFAMVRFFFCSAEDPFALYMTPVNIFPRKPPPYFHHSFPFLMTVEASLDNYQYESCDMHFDFEAAAAGILPLKGYLASLKNTVEIKKRNVLFKMEDPAWRCFVSSFSFLDKVGHILAFPENSGKIRSFYRLMDDIVAETVRLCDDEATEFMILAPFSQAPVTGWVHINPWLAEEGFLTFSGVNRDGHGSLNIDWPETKAYSLGGGSLYVNLQGREPEGIVSPGEKNALLLSLHSKLTAWQTPEGTSPVAEVTVRKGAGKSHREDHPDMLISFQQGYQSLPEGLWSPLHRKPLSAPSLAHYHAGHTSVDPGNVPGFMIFSRKSRRPDISVTDIAPTVFSYFDVDPPEALDGETFW